MVRDINDNPGGWSKTLPGHTVEFDSSYALPWVVSADLIIDAGATVASVITFADDDFIYFADMISVTPRAYTVFSVATYLTGVRYVYTTAQGWCNIPLRQNPSLQFIYGDTLDNRVVNRDASQRTFNVIVNGTKIPKPAGFAHGAF